MNPVAPPVTPVTVAAGGRARRACAFARLRARREGTRQARARTAVGRTGVASGLLRVAIVAGALVPAACAGKVAASPRGVSSARAPAAAPGPAAAPEPSPEERAAQAKRKAMEVALAAGLTTFDIHWSPARRLFALLPKVEGKTRLRIHADSGDVLSEFEPVGEPSELAFLDDGKLIYRAALPAPPPAKPGKARKGAKAAAAASAPAPAPRSVWVVQPVRPGTRAVRCDGDRHVWSKDHQHLAWVGRDDAGEFVGVDGTPQYPRHGRTGVQGEPSWSDDGRSLAFVELAHKKEARLVVLVEFDNPSGDATWPLPAQAQRPGLRVFWTGPGRVVVGESLTKPAFATSFEAQRSTADLPPGAGGPP